MFLNYSNYSSVSSIIESMKANLAMTSNKKLRRRVDNIKKRASVILPNRNSYFVNLNSLFPASPYAKLLKFLSFLVITCIDRIEKIQYPRKK